MITVRATKKENVFRAVSEGHAEGNPILCAASTCLMNTFRGSLHNLVEYGKPKAKVNCGKFEIKYIAQNENDEALAGALMSNLIIGILQLQETYPGEIKMIN